MHALGEDTLLLVSLVGAIRAENVLVMIFVGRFGGDWGLTGLLSGRVVTLLV